MGFPLFRSQTHWWTDLDWDYAYSERSLLFQVWALKPGRLELKSWLCPLLTVGSGAGHLVTVSLSVFLRELCVIMLTVSEGLRAERAQSLQSWMNLCNPVYHRPPNSSVHGILQARILEWVSMPSFRAFSQCRDRTFISCIDRQILYHWATREASDASLRANIFISPLLVERTFDHVKDWLLSLQPKQQRQGDISIATN